MPPSAPINSDRDGGRRKSLSNVHLPHLLHLRFNIMSSTHSPKTSFESNQIPVLPTQKASQPANSSSSNGGFWSSLGKVLSPDSQRGSSQDSNGKFGDNQAEFLLSLAYREASFYRGVSISLLLPRLVYLLSPCCAFVGPGMHVGDLRPSPAPAPHLGSAFVTGQLLSELPMVQRSADCNCL